MQSNNRHALLSPSGAAAWSRCPGKIAMEYGLPDSSSEYADQGTAAHLIAALCLQTNDDPINYFKRRVEVLDGEARLLDKEEGVSAERARAFQVDEDMVAAVRCYAKAVRSMAAGADIEVEVRVSIEHITGEKGAHGTADAVVLVGTTLQVHDLKYGVGDVVEAERNEQLLLYALGKYRKVRMVADIDEMLLVIHQPRISKTPKEWRLPLTEALQYGERLQQIAQTVRIALDHRDNWINGPDYSYLSPGEKQCAYCRARGTCPALAAHVQEVVGADFATLATHEADFSLADCDAATLSEKLQACTVVEKWIKAVRAEAERRIFGGEAIPGFKIVAGKSGARAWSDEAAAIKLLKSFRLKDEQIYARTLLSPPQAEKQLHAVGALSDKQWEKVTKLIVKSAGSDTIAPQSDPRPAKAAVTAQDFEHEEQPPKKRSMGDLL